MTSLAFAGVFSRILTIYQVGDYILPFKLVISDPETGKAIQYELDDAKTNSLVGKQVGEIVEGDALGLPGYKLKITGGSDTSGFPNNRRTLQSNGRCCTSY